MKPTPIEATLAQLAKVGFGARPAGPFMVTIFRTSDGKKFGQIHRNAVRSWLRGDVVKDWRGNKMPAVEAAAKAAA